MSTGKSCVTSGKKHEDQLQPPVPVPQRRLITSLVCFVEVSTAPDIERAL